MSLIDISFPPLFRGEAARPGVDPFAQAISAAALGCEPGLIIYNEGGETMIAALVLAPDAPLDQAITVAFAVALGFADALGALAPPEVGVHFDWPGGIRVNGAKCGRVRAAASTEDPAATPDWLVVGFELSLTLPGGAEPGADPDKTALFEEGCSEVDPYQLLESWSKHTLVWINAWLDDGLKKIHADWRSRAFAIGETITVEGQTGVFLGLDEACGLLLRQGEETRLIPLTSMLEA